MKFTEELKWRGMVQDITPETEEQLNRESTTGYIGFDPTADSLHVGSLVQIMLLKHFQRAGHKPLVLVGGATGMIGDPSGKSEERKLLSSEEVRHNETCIRQQLEKFLDFQCGENVAEIVNNSDWFQQLNILTFLRDVGKYLTVSYLLGKEHIKSRIEKEISFTEFNYILMQAYDFLWLLEHKNCKLQMGGSDQWGNITAGMELIRKKTRKTVYGFTCPLLVKSDGGKFGKTESGNVWLDAQKTSPYKFYQFWLNVSDEDAHRFIRIFTMFSKEETEMLEQEHAQAPHLRIMQKALAKDVTVRVHSEHDYRSAVEASEILFGKGTTETLKKLDESVLLGVFEGVPQIKMARTEVENNTGIIEFLSDKTSVFPSRGEARKMIQGGGVFVNKEKITDCNSAISNSHLLRNKYILIQKGKKNYYLLVVE